MAKRIANAMALPIDTRHAPIPYPFPYSATLRDSFRYLPEWSLYVA
jgi:hypothetical protein